MKHVLLQLPLGIQLQNENQLEQMANILEEIHEKYVPTVPSEGSVTLPDGSSRMYDNTTFHKLLFGGDQLTVARARGAIELRSLHAKSLHRGCHTSSGRLAHQNDTYEGIYQLFIYAWHSCQPSRFGRDTHDINTPVPSPARLHQLSRQTVIWIDSTSYAS